MTDETRNYLKSILTKIEEADYNSFNGNTALIFDDIIQMSGFKAYAGNQTPDAVRTFHEQRSFAYEQIIANKSVSKLSPSLTKDFVSSKVGSYEADVSLCERVNSCVDKYIDVLRTILSTLKEEMKTNTFNT